MTRAVADTNIFISAVMFGGLPGSFLDLALLFAFTLIVSQALLDELDEKLRGKFKLSGDEAMAIRAKITGVAEIVKPDITLDVIRDDPDDNRVLECAVASRADYIVSGDRHLRDLKDYTGTPILTVRQFQDIIAPRDASL